MSKPIKLRTHERYCQDIWAALVKHGSLSADERDAASCVKLLYSVSQDGLYGVTRHGGWKLAQDAVPKRRKPAKRKPGAEPEPKPCVHPHHHGHGAMLGIVAQGGETACQLATTVAHELGHVICGPGQGHNAVWRDACKRLGMVNVIAAGAHQPGWVHNFEPKLAKALQRIPLWNDGACATLAQAVGAIKATLGPSVLPPVLQGDIPPPVVKVKPCGAGFGTLGGRSRGKGSGSRMLKYTAKHTPPCTGPAILRCASTTLRAKCDACGAPWLLDDASLPPAHGMGPSGQGVAASTAKAHGARPPRAKRGSVKARHKAAGLSPAPAKGKTPAKARKAAARASQAPLAPVQTETPPEPEPVGSVQGVPVFAKPVAAFCDRHNGPVSLCGCKP